MARLTYAQATSSYGDGLLAVLASAENPDGTSYTLPVISGAPGAADIVSGHQEFTATTAATTVITVPAGRTWVGSIAIACDVALDAAVTTQGRAIATVTTAGAGVTPAAGTYFSPEARAGANATAGLVGTQGATSLVVPDFYVVAPAGNAVTVQAAATITGTAGRVSVSAIGRLI